MGTILGGEGGKVGASLCTFANNSQSNAGKGDDGLNGSIGATGDPGKPSKDRMGSFVELDGMLFWSAASGGLGSKGGWGTSGGGGGGNRYMHSSLLWIAVVKLQIVLEVVFGQQHLPSLSKTR